MRSQRPLRSEVQKQRYRDKQPSSTTRSDTHAYSVLAATNSGASAHLCCNRDFSETFEIHTELITLAGQNKIKAEGGSTVQCNFISVGRVAVKTL